MSRSRVAGPSRRAAGGPGRGVMGALLVLTAVAGCGGTPEATEEEQRAATADLMTAMGLQVTRGPTTVVSKDREYQVGTGVLDVEPSVAVEQAVAGLEAEGWEVRGTPTTSVGPGVLVADRPGLTTDVSVFEEVAGSPPDGGGVFVQVRVDVPENG